MAPVPFSIGLLSFVLSVESYLRFSFAAAIAALPPDAY